MRNKSDLLLFGIFTIIIFNLTFNLSTFPAYFWDQGVYVERAINFIDSLQAYDSQYYIDHPPLGWIILAGFFWPMDFPNSIIDVSDSSNSKDIESQLLLISFIPRVVIAFFTLIISVLVYKISHFLYNHKGISMVSLSSFAIIPSMWPFRNFLLDPIMIAFVLFSIYVLLGIFFPFSGSSSTPKSTSKIYPKILLSGFLFGIALLVKSSAIFFLPFILLIAIGYGLKWLVQNHDDLKDKAHEKSAFYFSVRQRIIFGIFWITPVLILSACWLIYLVQIGSFDYLISTQTWQANRTSSGPFESLPLLLATSPIGFLFGILGFAWIIKNKDQRIWSLAAFPYLVFLFRGGYVSFVHAIPLIPIWSIFAGKSAYLVLDKVVKKLIPNSHQNKRNLFRLKFFLFAILMAGSIATTIWISSFDDSKISRETIYWIIKNIPENSILVSDAGYSWIIKEYRPDITVLDIYSLNNLEETPEKFFYAEKSNPIRFDNILTKTQGLYEKSCLITIFQNNPNELGYFHPYVLLPENLWEVEIRYFDLNGCS